MKLNDAYLVPASFGEDEFVEKRSRFIGRAFPVSTPDEAIARINETRALCRDATHNVYAYIIREGNYMRYSDDGEPQGTAGMPVLEVLRREGVTDICCVVTRYFGGILLGAGGLTRAYAKGAKIALDAAGIAEMRPMTLFSVSTGYEFFEQVKRLLSSGGCDINDISYEDVVRISASVARESMDVIGADLIELTSGRVSAEIIGEKFAPKRIR